MEVMNVSVHVYTVCIFLEYVVPLQLVGAENGEEKEREVREGRRERARCFKHNALYVSETQ